MYPELSLEEAEHFLLPEEGVVGSYVVYNPQSHKVTDFVSFVHIHSSEMRLWRRRTRAVMCSTRWR